MTDSRPSRLWPSLAVLTVVGAVLFWVTRTSDVERFESGAGVALRGPAGAGAALVRSADGVWSVVDPRLPDTSTPIEGPILGEPHLSLGGTAFALHPDGMSFTRAAEGDSSRLEGLPIPPSARLLGVLYYKSAVSAAFRDLPLVGYAPTPGGPLTLAWVDLPELKTGELAKILRPIVTADGDTPALPADAELRISTYGPSFAFLGERGWEAWTLVGEEGEAETQVVKSDDGNSIIQAVLPGSWDPVAVSSAAGGHTRAEAHFAPDGKELIVEGRRDGGLYALDLLTGTLIFIAEGNLGASRRVSPGVGFRGDPVKLVSSQWGREDYLQISETNLRGGGRLNFKVSFLHNYLVALSPSGERMAYAGASFVEAGDEPFDETLYAFDFRDASRSTIELAERPGGGVDEGPLFVDDDVVIWIEDGVVHGLRYLSPETSAP